MQAFESLTPEQPALQIRYALYSDRIEIDLARPDQLAGHAGRRLTRHFGQTIAST